MADKRKNTDQMIDSLTDGLQSVRPVLPPLKRTLLWSAVLLTVMIATAYLLKGFRADITVKLASTEFVGENLVLVLIGILSLFAGFRLSVPDIRYGKAPFAIIGGIIAIGLAVNLFLFLTVDAHSIHTEVEQHGMFYHCITNLLSLIFAPAVAVYVLARKSAPVMPLWTGYAVLVGVLALGAAVMRHVCAVDSAAHLLIWHFLPALGISLCGILLGALLLRW